MGNHLLQALYAEASIESVNIAFDNSSIASEVRYTSISFGVFPFDPLLKINEDITNLQNNTSIQNLRQTYGADLVILMTNQGYPDYNGIVADFGPVEDAAYAIVEVGSMFFPSWTFAHEVVHLLGARHNRVLGVEDHICANGWKFVDENMESRNTMLALITTFTGSRELQYSNPLVNFNGVPTGDDDNNNAGYINTTACEISAFNNPVQLTAQIVGKESACECLATEPYFTEDWEYSAQLTSPPVPISGQAPYSYKWRWNTDGIFTDNNPGTLIGATELIYLNINYPCNQFFLKLEVTSADGVVVSDIKKIDTSKCGTCDPLPCLHGGNNSADFRSDNKSEVNNETYLIEEFKISPNPTIDYLDIEIHLSKETMVEILMTDITGKVISNVFTGVLNQGQSTFRYSTKEFQSGIYFCSLRSDSTIKNRKLVKQ